jgi:hypothetical protein
MDLDEVIARVLGRHVRLIAVCVIAGLLGAWLIHIDDRKQYEAAVRMVLDSPDPINQSQASVLADTARGIASGPALLRTALKKVGASRDPVVFGKENVDVQSLGSSGVLRLVVTDPEPRVAIAMSNTIADAVIAARSQVTEGTAVGAVRSLGRQIADLEDQLLALDARIDRFTPKGTSSTSNASSSNAAKLGAAERSRDSLTRQLGQLQGELVAIQGQRALRPQAGVIEAATSARPLPGRQLPDYLLGGLLGLILGVGAAAARETLVPTVVGHAALARALGAPILADLPEPPDRCGRKDVALAARHVELAGLAGGVTRVEVMSLDRDVDVSRFLEYLDDELTTPIVHGVTPLLSTRSAPVGRRPEGLGRTDRRPAAGPGGSERHTGLVVIVPDVVRQTALEPARNLLSITGWPLLGVVVFRRTNRYLPPRIPRIPRNRKPPDDAMATRISTPVRQHGNGAGA